MKRIFSLVVGLILCSLAFLPAYAAEEQTGIQISPVTFNFEISPDKSETGKILLTNRNKEEIKYIMEVELFDKISEEGAPSFQANKSEEGMSDLPDWISFKGQEITPTSEQQKQIEEREKDIKAGKIAEAEQIRVDLEKQGVLLEDTDSGTKTFESVKEGKLAPGEEKTIYFTIQVPEKAEPGGHYAGVFAREVRDASAGASELGVIRRVGALVLVSIPGDVDKSARIIEYTAPKLVWRGPIDFSMRVENTGSVHYDSKGLVELKPLLGKTSSVDLGTHTIIPKNIRHFEGTWGNKYPFGRYKVSFSATDGNGQPVIATAVLWAIPLVIVIPVIIFIILLILIVKYLKRHYKYQAQPVAGSSVAPPPQPRNPSQPQNPSPPLNQ